jgi:hypothetical protein
MFFQDFFRLLRTRRSAERRNEKHGAEITRRLRELIDASRSVPFDHKPPRIPSGNDEGHASDHKNRTA